MNAKEYQELVMATEADQAKIWRRFHDNWNWHTDKPLMLRLDTAARGLAGDCGEISTCIQRWIEYGQELDEVNLKEEIGDCLWRLAQLCKGVGITLEDAMISNIEKLKVRYPEKYSDEKAAESGRDREAEREVLENNKNQMSDPQREFAKEFIGIKDHKDLAGANLEQNGQGWLEPPYEFPKENLKAETEPQDKPEPGSVRDQLENRYDDPDYPFNCVFCKTKIYRDSERKVCPSCYSKFNNSVIKDSERPK